MDFGSSDFQETIIGEAVQAAVEDLSAGLIEGAPRVAARVIVVEELVAAVEPDLVVLNVGGQAALKVGDRLSVERVTREITDPATGAVIRRLSSQIGVVEVTDVDDISAIASIVEGSGFEVGDLAKTATE